ncbi:MAG: ornithine--oxo-acid transaminase [Deltaproteobacteria bacterium]|nr:ornithine--oxo-acid transaminase [Deltaproteobacteria bacterium]
MASKTQEVIDRAEKWGAHNYHPLPVVLTKAEGPFVWDIEGKRYLDMLSCYSALSHGHRNPRIIAAMERSLKTITLTSRAFYNEPYAEFCEKLARLAGLDMVLPMNSGAEAVETAIKIARAWGYRVKKVRSNAAHIITAAGNFHGRTISIVTFSTEEGYRAPFGPFTPGFSTIPYGDLDALEKAITPDTVAFLVEPIQGEGGIIVPPAGYLKKVVELCRKHNVLAIFDEVQTGLARTGRMFAFEHEDAKPDLLILGKALGGGIMPVSATVGTRAVMEVLQPGEHGSTFGGMPLSMVVGIEALDVLIDEKLSERAARLGEMAMGRLRDAKLPGVREVRGKGLLIGIQYEEYMGGAHTVGEALIRRGVLAKDTRVDTLRLAPSLTIEEKDLHEGLAAVEEATREVSAARKH